MSQVSVDFNVGIIGGGIIGCATAIGLAKLGCKVIVFESSKPHSFEQQQPPELRVSAINLHTLQWLKQHGIWDLVTAMRCRKYQSLSVWETETHKTHFHAKQIQQENLGYFVENRILQLALIDYIETHLSGQVSIDFERSVEYINTKTGTISLNNGEVINTHIVVGADGAGSVVRQLAQIGTTGWDYAQSAMVISIQRPHIHTNDNSQSRTWQTFSSTGPVAFLPMHENYANLVWYHSQQHIKRRLLLDNEQLRQEVEVAFPKDLGQFTVLDKAAFSITRRHANAYSQDRVVLVGDAAHTINPLAGQGLNLGFKDVASLCDALAAVDFSIVEQSSDKMKQAFKQYERQRRSKNLLMMSAMDTLYLTFSNDLLPIKHVRNIGLALANLAGPIKNKALMYAVGLQ